MLLFGHLGITLGVYLGLGTFISRLRFIIDPKYLAIGALLPDLIDKPIGRVIFASTLANGRIIGHTLLFTLLIALTGVHLYEKIKDSIRLALASGCFPPSGRSYVGAALNIFLAFPRIKFSQRFHGIYWTGIFVKNTREIF
jgi:hypothetical protein